VRFAAGPPIDEDRDVRIGVNLPNFGPTATRSPIGELARRAEDAGFDSVWVSDHVVMPVAVESAYPFSPDGAFPWPVDEPWFDPLIALSFAAAHTERVELGIGVLIAPLRHPVVLAKQVASLDAYAGGRFVLGVGAGWMSEEFDLLDIPWEARAGRLEDTVQILRSCWRGESIAYEGKVLSLAAGVRCVPTPARDLPVLFGASTPAGLRRAGRLGNGFVGFALARQIDVDEIARVVGAIRAEARDHGREASVDRIVYRVSGRADEVAAVIPALAQAGVTEVVVSVSWSDPEAPRSSAEALRTAIG
jgi:probable F420-dependent oxidoreductase